MMVLAPQVHTIVDPVTCPLINTIEYLRHISLRPIIYIWVFSEKDDLFLNEWTIWKSFEIYSFPNWTINTIPCHFELTILDGLLSPFAPNNPIKSYTICLKVLGGPIISRKSTWKQNCNPIPLQIVFYTWCHEYNNI